jgi:3-oxoacyl-[acyl-carrier protein] reductase
MLLQNKNAIIYGGGGSLGGAVAKALAREGTKVFVTGLHKQNVQKTASDIIAAGGKAEAAVVDALNATSIEKYLQEVVKKAGSIDITFNAISLDPVQNIPFVKMNASDFLRPIQRAMESHFLTATAAGRIMIEQGFGVILSLTATPGGIGYPLTGGFGVACTAIEKFSCNLASEIGKYGVRVVNIRSGGSPDSRPFMEGRQNVGDAIMDSVIEKISMDTMLKKMPPMIDIANTAVFLASDWAKMITGVTVDVTAGSCSAINHKVNYEEDGAKNTEI